MADASYTPKVYKAQGGANLVVTSSGTLTLEGTQTVASGGTLSVASGGTLSIAGTVSVTSGGGAFKLPSVSIATSATTIPANGLSLIAGTTAGPTFLIANPIAGAAAYLCLEPSSSGVTHRAIIAAASTGVSFGTTGGNQITLATSALRNVCLVGASTTKYRIFGVFTSTMGGVGNVST